MKSKSFAFGLSFSEITFFNFHISSFSCLFTDQSIRCTFLNAGDHALCAMCEHINPKILRITTWQRVIQLNHTATITVPQWLKCSQCSKWRTIHIPISSLRTWSPPPDWDCTREPSIESKGGCNFEFQNPNSGQWSDWELFVLKVQRLLAMINEAAHSDGAKQAMSVLSNTITRYEAFVTSQTDAANSENNADSNNNTNSEPVPSSQLKAESDSNQNDNDHGVQTSPNSWNCSICTFKNNHSGNQCTMCDTPKPGTV